MRFISPSILAADPGRLSNEAEAIASAGADWLHLDVMDGHFVPNITYGPWIVELAKKAVNIPLDAHLMVSDPLFWAPIFAQKGAHYVSVHLEATVHLHKVLSSIRDLGVKSGVAINPATPIGNLVPALPWLDLIIVMGVNPGFAGQPFIPETVSRVKELKGLLEDKGAKEILIEVDGGVTDQNAKALWDAGADALVSGSFLFKSSDKAATIKDLRKA
ncbi:MAG: ribulose-phosphate 3-epimerase [Deltaproteobacteria bacterium]|jgi:ribulose-phosphate 3-epimerase|nr:ribulose-phosphate 3-epimerase [Deltaproteobacteria bacterium]